MSRIAKAGYLYKVTDGDRTVRMFKTVLGAGLGFWAIVLSLGMAKLGADILFPERELAAVDTPLPRLRDALATLPEPGTPRRLPIPPSAEPAPTEVPEPIRPRASASASPAVDAEAFEDEPLPAAESPRAALQPALSASAGPSGLMGGGSAFAAVPRGDLSARSRENAPPPALDAPSRVGPVKRSGWTPSRQAVGGIESSPDAYEDSGTSEAGAVERILAAAGIAASGRGAGLTPFPGGNPNAPIVSPAFAAAAGGRTGQGSHSMEAGGAATPATFDPDAKGLGAETGKLPPGPVLRAGSAPPLPSAHVPHIAAAAKAAGIDPALLAATAARESHFGERAYRAEPHLASVQWRKDPNSPKEKYFDGSIGPTQVLRSNFLSRGIDNDREAYSLANNYRIAAKIIRSNLDAFPGNSWKAVAAYNVGQYGAKLGRVPANRYTETILSWRGEYSRALAPYVD